MTRRHCDHSLKTIRSGGKSESGQNLINHIAGDVGEPEIASLELKRQLGVLNAQAVQDGGLQVVDVDRVFQNVVTEVVGLAQNEAALDATPRHPHRSEEHTSELQSRQYLVCRL